ncbi:hypothetical protein [uncultured Lacinutrix sp.]|uniref:hypothetical protein n=1 Tax=uncultured Lacinutrix sp. TaxID=574032 RepID=UPI0026156DBF|nr:hypothetical protein [uncultured Lacinutrix sp.]
MSFNTREVIIPIENEIASINQVGEVEIVIISKDASDAELEKIKKQFKKQGFSLEFKGLKRNKNNEITKIKISAKSKNSKAKYEADSKEPIPNISIKFDSNDDSISIGSDSKSSNEFHFSSKHGNGHTKHTTHIKHSNYEKHDVNEEHEEHQESEEHEEHEIKESKSNVFVFSSNDNNSGNNEDIEVIIENGKHKVKRSKNDGNVFIIKETDKHKGKHTEDITIIKEQNGNTVKKEVIINGDSGGKTIIEDDHIININSNGNKGNIMFTSDTNKNPLIIYDGKQISKDKLKDLDSKKIKSINVLKGESATSLHGEKGKDGVIIISSKE